MRARVRVCHDISRYRDNLDINLDISRYIEIYLERRAPEDLAEEAVVAQCDLELGDHLCELDLITIELSSV